MRDIVLFCFLICKHVLQRRCIVYDLGLWISLFTDSGSTGKTLPLSVSGFSNAACRGITVVGVCGWTSSFGDGKAGVVRSTCSGFLWSKKVFVYSSIHCDSIHHWISVWITRPSVCRCRRWTFPMEVEFWPLLVRRTPVLDRSDFGNILSVAAWTRTHSSGSSGVFQCSSWTVSHPWLTVVYMGEYHVGLLHVALMPATSHPPKVSPFAIRHGQGGFNASFQPSLAMCSMVRIVHPYEPPLCPWYFMAALIRSRFGWVENTKPLSLSGV